MKKNIEYTDRGMSLPPNIVDDLTRRDFLIGGAAALLLGGCGGSGDGGNGASGKGERTITDEYATSTVSGAPERVVTVYDTGDLDACLALGVDVLAFGSSPGSLTSEMPWKQSGLEETGAELLPIGEGPNIERIAVLEPDLIFSSYHDEAVMDRLRDLCPVIFIDTRYWRKALRIAGRALYLDDEAEAVIAEVEQNISRTGESIADRIPASVDVLSTYDESNANVLLNNRRSGFGSLLEEVGFPSLRQGEDEGGLDEISRELLPEMLTSESLILLDYGYEGDELTSATEELLNDPLIADTPAIKSGRVLRLTPEETAASYLMSALSIPTLLESLRRFPA